MLAHRPLSLRPRSAQIFLSTLSYILLLACIILHLAPSASAQTVVNGQVYTKALAIVDAPQVGSTYNAGSDISIAIDTSGNGQLSTAATIPNSGLATSYDSLEIYLVSSQTGVNVTVSSGSGLLTQESGSTVKHVNWAVPNCLDAGAYNLTFYEGSHVSGAAYFSITPLSLVLENANPGSSCDIQTNTLETQPQADSAPAVNPWLGGTSTASTTPAPSTSTTSPNPTTTPTLSKTSSTPSVSFTALTSPSAGSTQTTSGSSRSPAGVWTLTVGPSGLSWPVTITTGTHTTSSPAPGQTITRTIGQSIPPTTVTVVLESLQAQTLTFTGSGLTSVLTTTATSFSTTTAIMQVSDGDTAGFFPVSSSASRLNGHLWLWVFALSVGPIIILLL